MTRNMFVLLALMFAGQVFADKPQIQQTKPSSSLKLTLKALQGSWVFGEPVRFEATLENVSTEAVKIYEVWIDHAEGVPIELSVSADGNIFGRTPWITRAPRDLFPVPPSAQIPARGKNSWYEMLDYDPPIDASDPYVFPKPGRYLVKANLLLPGPGDVHLESAPVEVSITEPTGHDKDAFEFLKERGLEGHLSELAPRRNPHVKDKRAAFDDLKEFMARFPSSVYAPHAQFGLAMLLYDQWSTASSGVSAEEQKKNLRQVLPALEDFARDKCEPIAALATFSLAKAYDSLSDWEGVRRCAGSCLAKHPCISPEAMNKLLKSADLGERIDKARKQKEGGE